ASGSPPSSAPSPSQNPLPSAPGNSTPPPSPAPDTPSRAVPPVPPGAPASTAPASTAPAAPHVAAPSPVRPARSHAAVAAAPMPAPSSSDAPKGTDAQRLLADAVIALRHEHDPSRATALLARYLDRYPDDT